MEAVTGKLDEISTAIGELRSEVRTLTDANRAGSDSRSRIHEKLEGLRSDVKDVKTNTENLTNRITAIEPTVAEIKIWRERGIGALMLVSFTAAVLGGAIVIVGKRIWAAIFG